NAGTADGTPTADQRGQPRTGTRDIGAVEFFGVVAVSSPVPDGTYHAGDVFPIMVTFSDPVFVFPGPGGALPRLTLATGANDAVPDLVTGGFGNDTMIFLYTVAPGHVSPDLDYASAAALDLNTAILVDSIFGGRSVPVELPAPGEPGSLATSKDIVVD